jgi:acetylornithine deacetylase/succinyl-diaminopimelate desuccinylase-like protein
VVPQLTTGATDARFLRLKGVPCYGINPCPTEEEEEGTLHGPNERVRLASVAFGVRFVREVVLEVAR